MGASRETAVQGGEGKREGVGAGVEASSLQRVHPLPAEGGWYPVLELIDQYLKHREVSSRYFRCPARPEMKALKIYRKPCICM